MKKLLLSLLAVAGLGFTTNAGIVEEVLTIDKFGVTATLSYQDVEYTSTITGITYKGNLCKANETNGFGMQFRTTSGKEAGLVATANPKNAIIKSVTVEPSTTASTTNQWDVYGKNGVYSTFKDLYNTETAGTLIGSGTSSNTVTSASDFTGFGFRGKKNAIYINKITITYEIAGEETKKSADLSFPETSYTIELGQDFTAPTLVNPNSLEVTYSSSNPEVAEVAADGAVTIKAVGNATITAKSAETDEYYAGSASYTINVKKPMVEVTVELATTMSDGKFVFYTPEGVAMNYTGTAAYGYLFIENVTVENNAFVVNQDYLIEFKNTDKGYTMQDYRGLYMGMDATHWGSFNFYEKPDATNANCYWTVTFEGDNVKIENIGRTGAYLSYKQYSGKYEIVTTDNADQPLIQLYKEKASSTGIDCVVVDENAPVEYYNLQGVRVANPENGLYIRRQGNKATKVLVK